jgi:hypothetical protein
MKEFKPTEDQILAAGKVFICMAQIESIKPVITKIKTDLLLKHKYKYRSDIADRRNIDDEFITNPDHTYLISDKDAGHYFTELHHQYINAGFDVPLHYCPLLIAEDEYRKARQLLIDAMEPITNMSYEKIATSYNCLDNLRKITELTLRLLVPYVKKVTDKVIH